MVLFLLFFFFFHQGLLGSFSSLSLKGVEERTLKTDTFGQSCIIHDEENSTFSFLDPVNKDRNSLKYPSIDKGRVAFSLFQNNLNSSINSMKYGLRDDAFVSLSIETVNDSTELDDSDRKINKSYYRIDDQGKCLPRVEIRRDKINGHFGDCYKVVFFEASRYTYNSDRYAPNSDYLSDANRYLPNADTVMCLLMANALAFIAFKNQHNPVIVLNSDIGKQIAASILPFIEPGLPVDLVRRGGFEHCPRSPVSLSWFGKYSQLTVACDRVQTLNAKTLVNSLLFFADESGLLIDKDGNSLIRSVAELKPFAVHIIRHYQEKRITYELKNDGKLSVSPCVQEVPTEPEVVNDDSLLSKGVGSKEKPLIGETVGKEDVEGINAFLNGLNESETELFQIILNLIKIHPILTDKGYAFSELLPSVMKILFGQGESLTGEERLKKALLWVKEALALSDKAASNSKPEKKKLGVLGAERVIERQNSEAFNTLPKRIAKACWSSLGMTLKIIKYFCTIGGAVCVMINLRNALVCMSLNRNYPY